MPPLPLLPPSILQNPGKNVVCGAAAWHGSLQNACQISFPIITRLCDFLNCFIVYHEIESRDSIGKSIKFSQMVTTQSHVDPFLISTIRFWIIGLMSTPISVMLSKQNEELPVFPAGKRRLLLIRSVLGATNLMTHFYSLQVRYAMFRKILFEVVFDFFLSL